LAGKKCVALKLAPAAGATAAGARYSLLLSAAGGPLLFLASASLFCALSPTGYLPAVAAGATFTPAPSAARTISASLRVGLRVGYLYKNGSPSS
jgi:hypothetical protein